MITENCVVMKKRILITFQFMSNHLTVISKCLENSYAIKMFMKH